MGVDGADATHCGREGERADVRAQIEHDRAGVERAECQLERRREERAERGDDVADLVTGRGNDDVERAAARDLQTGPSPVGDQAVFVFGCHRSVLDESTISRSVAVTWSNVHDRLWARAISAKPSRGC